MLLLLLTYLTPPGRGQPPQPSGTPFVHAANLGDTNQPMINFYPDFFNRRNLEDSVTRDSSPRDLFKYNLEESDNRALISSYYDDEEKAQQLIRGALWTKIMARWHKPDISSSGYYVNEVRTT
ncbi:hypothetical protein OCU04_003557 [Sclerotinia nivalis]|uniref:Uncharacterized protein n=1 Tax=Sclerotinia nivalis TaxID=352851 RepID=A0A9X0AS77_9HELO|nr:hypothetical protein OCU04_003557 [Sclerotinia nivalis]